ncbi:MAG: hypothetical protein OXH70_11870 [Acidobacteria bacterium]|nr:hypothetical protein [Acidobacteriota bacterium]
MRALNVFRDWTRAGGQLGFYTKQTKDRIPPVDGCYAWFFPLWIYREDLEQQLDVLDRVFRYDPAPERQVDAAFNWESVRLRLRRHAHVCVTPAKVRTWNGLLADRKDRVMLERTLLEASLLMPPLYVGKTSNLQRRYLQHVEGAGKLNHFHRRFDECVRASGLALTVSDLLFVCIRTAPDEKTSGTTQSAIDELIEQILMQACRPPFSLK